MPPPTLDRYLNTIIQGDCLEVMRGWPDNCVDAVVTDPPYGLEFMGKEWDRLWREYDNEKDAEYRSDGRTAAKFQMKRPSYRAGIDMQSWHHAWAKQAYRVLKPGGYLLAFGGSRTYHRLACAIEDAGFEIRDQMQWLTGQGFPKNLNIGCRCRGKPLSYGHDEEDTESTTEHGMRSVRTADLSATVNVEGECREVLYPGVPEPGAPGHRPTTNVSSDDREGQSGLEGRKLHRTGQGLSDDSQTGPSTGQGERVCVGAHPSGREDAGPSAGTRRRDTPQERQEGRQPASESSGVHDAQDALGRATHRDGSRCPRCGGLKDWVGFGTALKPAHEPICLARKPLSEKTVAANVLKWGTGALNVDGCRIETTDSLGGGMLKGTNPVSEGWDRPWRHDAETIKRKAAETADKVAHAEHKGRWPANVILDEEAGRMLDEQSGERASGGGIKNPVGRKGLGWKCSSNSEDSGYYPPNIGGASRFFYCPKASRKERGKDNRHPTVKPITLMAYLCRLVTPPGGIVLDPFVGSGSTFIAARQEGFHCIGIEKDPESVATARARIHNDSPLFTAATEKR